ncbi:MAG: hypothetical protein COB15_17285 [Flavobacteriales bacterium]|nr:MAG: hypothetical protein COB15_17285 [Flavobacteriales bacterium]
MFSRKNILIYSIIVIALIVLGVRIYKIETENQKNLKALLNQPKTELEIKMDQFEKNKRDSLSLEKNKRLKSAIDFHKIKRKKYETVGQWMDGENSVLFIIEKKGIRFVSEITIETKKMTDIYELMEKKLPNGIGYMRKDIVEDKTLVGEADWYKIEYNGDLTDNDKIGVLSYFKKIEI